MKVLGICGSPRKRGNTEIALLECLKEIEKSGIETEIVTLHDKDIRFCNHCNACIKGDCPIRDDVPGILERMASADAIVLASPVYLGNVTGQVKTLMDRTLPLRRHEMKLRNKIGGAIGVGASRNGGQEFVCGAIQRFILLHEMLVVSDMNTAHFGGTGLGSHEKGTIKNDDFGLSTMRNLGKKIAMVLKEKG